jgi:hypothetical protein
VADVLYAVSLLSARPDVDAYYPLDRFQPSHELLRRERTLRMTPDFAHSHEDGWSPVEICEFMNAHLQEAAPLPRLGRLATYFLTVEDPRGLVVSSPYCDG